MRYITDFFLNAYYHCLHYTINKKLHWLERLFWLICIIASMSGAIFVVHQSFHAFRSTKVPIRVSTDYLDTVTPFPAIFFCEKKEIKGKVDQMIRTLNFSLATNNSKVDITNFVRWFTFIRPGDPDLKLKTCEDPEKDYCRFTMTYKKKFQIFTKYIRATCEEIFTSCTFNGQRFPCCKSFLPVATFEGTCYALNSLNAITGDNNHNASDDKIPTKRLVDKYLPYKLKHTREHNPANLSVEVRHPELYVWYLGNGNVPTKMYQKENQFYLNEGKTSQSIDMYLRVQEVLIDDSIISLPIEQRKCRFSHENSTLKVFGTYTTSACEIECLRTAQLIYCNCVVHLLPKQSGIELREPACNLEGIVCSADDTRIKNYLSKNCSCLSNCHVFDVFPVGKVFHENNLRFRNASSTHRINFIVRAPTLRYVRYATQDSLGFIVSIGGAVTLFTGCSFLSVAQIFYYILLKPLSERCMAENVTWKTFFMKK